MYRWTWKKPCRPKSSANCLLVFGLIFIIKFTFGISKWWLLARVLALLWHNPMKVGAGIKVLTNNLKRKKKCQDTGFTRSVCVAKITFRKYFNPSKTYNYILGQGYLPCSWFPPVFLDLAWTKLWIPRRWVTRANCTWIWVNKQTTNSLAYTHTRGFLLKWRVKISTFGLSPSSLSSS